MGERGGASVGDAVGSLGHEQETFEAGLSAAWPGIRDEQTADVLGALSPTARRILTAAHRVLEREGYESLSLRRIAREAGETKSLITYHFENKAGLINTLVDSLWHDADIALMEEVEALGADPRGRVLALTGVHRRLALQPGLYRTYFDLLPFVLRDTDALARLTRTYRSYRRVGELCLAPAVGNVAEALPLATVLLAIGEGIAVQTLLAGDDALLAPALAVLERRVLDHLGLEPVAMPPAVTWPSGAGSLGDLEDPAAGLAPAADRVLQAALVLLNEEGPRALTAEALAAQSGEPSSSVFYHFGDKRGLIAAVVAASDYRFGCAMVRAARPFASRGPSPAVVADVTARIFAQPGWMRTFVDVLPVVLRDEALCRQEATFVATVRDTIAAFFREGMVAEQEALPLASLSLALTHGLAIQLLVDRRGTPVDAALATWRTLLERAADDPEA
jgi:AcrR family transcriptional regulator